MEFLLNLEYRSNFREDVLLKVFYSIISFQSVDCKYLRAGCPFLSLFATSLHSPSFHVLFFYSSSFFGYVSNIVQCSMWEYLIKRKKKERTFGPAEMFSTWLPCYIFFTFLHWISYTFYFSTFPMYSCQLFFFCPVLNISLPVILLLRLISHH